MNENEISTIVITQKPKLEKPNLQEILEEIACEEVTRLKRNLGALDDLELMLMENIKLQLSMNGFVDSGTLMKVIKTFNNSVDRSSNIIKDRNSSLIQVLIDNRTVQDNKISKATEQEMSSLDLRSRKKIQSLLNALVTESESEDEEVMETNDDKQVSDRGTTEEQNS